MTVHEHNGDFTADSCARVRPLLEAYHDDAVDAGQEQRVSRHLDRCAACTATLAQLRVLRETLAAPVRAELAEDPTADLWVRVAAELDRQETVRLRSSEMAGRLLGRLMEKYARPALAVATATALVVAALIAPPHTPQQVNVARDTFTIEEIETPDAGVLVYEADPTDMTIIWVIEREDEEPPTGADGRAAL